MESDFKKASDLVSSLFSTFDGNGLNQANAFMGAWNEIAGPQIAAHSKVLDVDKGVVILEVDHAGWSQRILLMKKRLIRELSSRFRELAIKNLVVRVVSECKTPYKRQDTPVGEGIPRVETGSPEEVDVSVREDIPDELKSVLERLRTSIRKGKPGRLES